jgi:type I restriction enzyme S subunit
MDPQQFLDEFGHVANAPGGIARVRELVLFFAVRGELASQQQLDRERLGKVRSEIEQQKTNDKRARFRVLEPISVADEPYQVPETWMWVRLGELVEVLDSQRKPITKSHRQPGPIPYYGASGIVDRVATYIFDEALVLVGEDGAKWGRGEPTAFKISGKAWVNNHAHVIRPRRDFLSDDYLVLVLAEKDLTEFITGMTVPKLNQNRLISIPIPLPPLEEQSRIVAKVDELMALCSQLEALQEDRRKLQNALRKSTLQAFASAQSPHELQGSWQRLQANFASFVTEPEDVRLLRDVLFDLALRGVLLSDSNLAQGDNFSDGELRPLPNGWVWKTLSDLSEYITSGSRGWKTYMASTGDSFIRSQDIRQDALIFDNPAFVNLPDRVEGKRTLVHPGDILLTITGGNVGRCAVAPELPNKAYVSQHVALIRLWESSLSEFIHFWMINAFGGRAFLARYIYGDKPGLNLAQVASVPIPVPPAPVLPEILRSLRRNQQLCDGLAKQLGAKRDVATKLSCVVVASLTGITIENAEGAVVKAPQTELIATLRLSTPPDLKAQAPLATLLARHNGEMSPRDLWQRFGGEIEAFYEQLKAEVAHGWIAEPAVAEMREKATDAAEA